MTTVLSVLAILVSVSHAVSTVVGWYRKHADEIANLSSAAAELGPEAAAVLGQIRARAAARRR